jgi:hypothetical protein
LWAEHADVVHTRFFWIWILDCGEFWIRVLLFFHGNERLEAKALEAFINEHMANAMH